ncbi:hypothetical protein Tco_1253177 [Tanacetum coccineum]
MAEYIRLQEEKALSRGETFNWQTATYGKMEYCEDEDDCFTNFESEFPAIVLENPRMPSFPSPEPEVSYSNDFDFFKDFENEFPAIVYNDALTSKSDFLTEHISASLDVSSRTIVGNSDSKFVKQCPIFNNNSIFTAFLKEIVLRRADYKEYKISEADFKNLHLNDFEDMYLLHLQGQLNHLSGADKVHLFNAVNLWIRNIVIRKRVENLQLRIESYQTKLNLTQPDWDASDFLFKEDYTIVSKPRAVIYRDRNDQNKMMRETEVHKFSDGTLQRILDKLDHMVKDFKLYEYNLSMETRV